MTRTRHKASGFSLLESVLYIALSTMLLVVMTNVSISLAEHRAEAYARAETLYATSFALRSLRAHIQSATAITSPVSGAVASELTFIDTHGVSGTIRIDNDTLILDRENGERSVLTPPTATMAYLSFERTSDNQFAHLRVRATITDTTPTQSSSLTIEEAMGSRITPL